MASMLHRSHVHDIKQEGAIEAARDPDSSATAEDAERVMVDETKKAGGAAFAFNADASPEEKAAQAKANVPDGFHHERKPKATAVISDVDDGTATKYDLPPPTKEGAIAPDSPTFNKNVTANGGAPEESQWSRTGWAPRFGQGDPADDEGATLLEHQTFLEGKLDDKWFGDWYYNAGVIIFACMATHVCTILGGGLASMFVVMAVCSTYYRTSLRRVRRNFRDDVHREMAKSRLETDTESLEWINSFLVKFWPIYAPVLCATIISSVDQVLSTSTPAFLDSLRMKLFQLGTKPPRLEYVKTYPKTEEDTVLMDWKFSFNPNDTADMTARQLKNKLNPKIVLEVRIGKGFVSKGLDVIVEDMAFSGLMRVKVKLQIPFPHIEKVEICFLERPHIDYVCKPLGGDTFGFDINFVPGLESFIQEQIHANLAPVMYDPNVFPIEIAKMLAGTAVDQAIGVLQISLHGGHGLKNPDKFPGIPDAYVTASINSREVLGRTKTIEQNANPRWNETINIIITSLKDVLTLQAYDWNEYRKDKDLGIASFSLDQLEQETVFENQQLEVLSGGKARGVIQCDVRFFPVLEGLKSPDGTTEAIPESNNGIVKFTVEQAKDLDGSKSLVGQLSPYAVLLLNGKEVQTSQTMKRTNNPIWPNATKELLITDRKSAKLGLVIKDSRDLGADPILGTYQIKLDDMLELMAKGQEWYHLAGAQAGRAKMQMQWKPVALAGGASGSGGYVTPIGVMRFQFQSARDLRNLEAMGKSDPYVRVLLSGIQKRRTVTFQNNLNPDFDETVYVPVHSTREKLTVEVMDEENIGADRSLGAVQIDVSEYVVQGDDGEYLVNDEKRQRSDPLRAGPRGAAKGSLNFTCAFYPTYNVAEPSKDGEEDAMPKTPTTPRKSGDAASPVASRHERSGTISSLKQSDAAAAMSRQLAEGEKEQGEVEDVKREGPPKITLTPDDISHYESGLIVFKLLDADLAHSDCHIEVLIDDHLFPSYSSSKLRSKQLTINETGDAMIRETDVSRITLRLSEKLDSKGEGKEAHIYAKLTGQTIDVLRQGLYTAIPLTLKGDDGRESRVHVELKYLPIKMRLDPSESINNMGTLRVEIHDAADLPAADRNGFSDPYCKFIYNGKTVHKTEVQKKTLHPAWNERFEVAVKSRTAANLRIEVYDWDLGDSDDHLGSADINLNLLEPFQAQPITLGLDGKSGTVRLHMLFKPDYITRARQGSSTFQGTFAVPGKVIGAPVKGVGKGAVFLGGNVIRGATFVGKGFRRRKTNENKEDIVETTENPPVPTINESQTNSSAPTADGKLSRGHTRDVSTGGASMTSGQGPSAGASAEAGTATFALVSAAGFDGDNLRVFVKQHTAKGQKEVHKSKSTKAAPGSEIQFDEGHETFNVKCAVDTQFTVQVKDMHTFGADKDLGESMLVVADASAGGASKIVQCGNGQIVVKSSFTPTETSSGLAPASSPSRPMSRRFLAKTPRESRQSTPADG
ncbi:MAG: hypothetical protein M1828_003698 [Chrysothrix sp. TS-e1954]|nr:MAG: hypothetical protein M1828_003698 [Chrysothrix sp. TS-e1954]